MKTNHSLPITVPDCLCPPDKGVRGVVFVPQTFEFASVRSRAFVGGVSNPDAYDKSP